MALAVFLSLQLLAALAPVPGVYAKTLKVDIPRARAARAVGPLDSALASLSIELTYFSDFAGNYSHPNALFGKAIKLYSDRTGKSPDIRPGGITADSAWFDSSQKAAIIRDQSQSGGIYRTNLGPAWYESFTLLPPDTIFTVDLNLQNNSLANTTAQMLSALKYIPRSQIFSFELGNEPDHFSSTWGGYRPWNMAAYVDKYLNWTSALSRAAGFTTAMFGAGTFADDPPSGHFNTTGIIALGAEKNGLTNSYSQHMYQYSTCDPYRNARATVANLISHKNVTNYVDLWLPHINAARELGKPFTVGEYNSVSCSGKINVTDTFGQALWVVDTVLWSAYRGVKQLFLHQGATLVFQSSTQANRPGYSKYNLIVPTGSEATGPARLTPGFVSYLMLGEAVGRGGESSISVLDSKGMEDLGLYAIWEKRKLSRIVALNMKPYNGTDGWWIWNETVSERPSTGQRRGSVVLDLREASSEKLKVKRMTSTGLNEKNPRLVTWAGQEYYTGDPTGEYVEETVEDGLVEVGDSEAALIFVAS